jgi:hypothetical protein
MSSGQLTLLQVDSHVRTYQWPAAARAWLESGRDCGLSSIALLTAFGRDGLSSKTCPDFYPATEDETLPSSFAGWSNAGMASPGGFLTLNTSEWPSHGVECSLWQVLETEPQPPQFLTPRALNGIRRRLESKSVKTTPEMIAAISMGIGGMDED